MNILVLSVIVLLRQADATWDTPPSVEHTPKFCELERLHASEVLTSGGGNILLQKLRELNVPTVIEGAIEQWPALQLWGNQEYFIHKFGHIPIHDELLVNSTLDVAQDGPNIKTTSTGATLGHFLQSMSKPNPSSSASSSSVDPYSEPFLFQRAPHDKSLIRFLSEDLTALGSENTNGGESRDEVSSGKSKKKKKKKKKSRPIPTPSLLAPFGGGFSKWHVLSIGGRSGGLPPHKHTASWLGLVVGRKHWTFLHPDDLSVAAIAASMESQGQGNITGSGGVTFSGMSALDLYAQAALNSPSQWKEEVWNILGGKGKTKDRGEEKGTTTDKRVLQCIQEVGEVIYIPHLWWHATGNLGDVIGIGAQADGFQLPRALSPQQLYPGCGMALSQGCSGLLQSTSENYDDATEEENEEGEGYSSLVSGGESGSGEACTPEVQRKLSIRAYDLEPLNVKHILGNADKMLSLPYEYVNKKTRKKQKKRKNNPDADTPQIAPGMPNPLSDVVTFLAGCATMVKEQVLKGHMSRADGGNMVGRMGIWLDKAPALASQSLPPIIQEDKTRSPSTFTQHAWVGDGATEMFYRSNIAQLRELYKELRTDIAEGGGETDTAQRIQDKDTTLKNMKGNEKKTTKKNKNKYKTNSKRSTTGQGGASNEL